MSQTTLNDSFLWYNVGQWGPLGLAVPNFGDDGQTQNSAILDLTSVIARNLQAIMFHTDASLSRPPSINTIIRIGQLCDRARSILASRAIPSNRPNLETQHAAPAPTDFLVYPVPFFKVRNPWLKRWCELLLYALTDAYQHTENRVPLEISTTFSAAVGQYLQRVYYQLAVELLQQSPATAMANDFQITAAMYQSYAPEKFVTSVELIDTVPDLQVIPTEDRLSVLTAGIPTSFLPVLPPWPGVASIRDGGATAFEPTAAPTPAFATMPVPGA